MKFRRQATEEISVNLTPLIDIVFLLLIFFMVSTTFTRETRLTLELPEAVGDQPASEAQFIEVSISSKGDYAVNGQLLADNRQETLAAAIQQLAQGNTGLPFIISADAKSTHQDVVTVMDVAGKLGFVNLSIATREPASE